MAANATEATSGDAPRTLAEALRDDVRRALRARVHQTVQSLNESLARSDGSGADDLDRIFARLQSCLQVASSLDRLLRDWIPPAAPHPTAARTARRHGGVPRPRSEDYTPLPVLAPLIAKVLLATPSDGIVRPTTVVQALYSVLRGQLLPGDLRRARGSYLASWEERVRHYLYHLARHGWLEKASRGTYRVAPEGRKRLEALREGQLRLSRAGRVLLAASPKS